MEKIECKEFVKLEDGSHEGVITKVQRRNEKFDYTDIVISLNEGKSEIRTGFPTFITADSKLGKLLTKFGIKLEVGKFYDPESCLIGKKVFFMTLTDTTKEGKEYAYIVKNSIKPLEVKEEIVK